MKSLIICAEYISSWKEQQDGSRKLLIDYQNITCFGQTKENPIITCIVAGARISNSDYNDLIKYCKMLFCNYFKVDDFNIFTVEYLVNISS